MFPLVPDGKIKAILDGTKTIAVVGMSPKPERPSHQVARYLLGKGYTIIPVNPGHDRILDLPCYPNLLAVPVAVDMADIFRRSEEVLPIVEQAVAKGVRTIWMQQGIVNEEAARLAVNNGLTVIMDRCLQVDHQNLLG